LASIPNIRDHQFLLSQILCF